MPATDSEGIDPRHNEYIQLHLPFLCGGAPSGIEARHALLSLNPCRLLPDVATNQPASLGPLRNTPVRLVTFSSQKGVTGPYAGVMKILVSKGALNRMALCVCFLSALPIAQAIAQGTEPIMIPMTADHWQTRENAEFLR